MDVVKWIEDKEKTADGNEYKETLRDIKGMLSDVMHKMIISPITGRMFAMLPAKSFCISDKRNALKESLLKHGIDRDCSGAHV